MTEEAYKKIKDRNNRNKVEKTAEIQSDNTNNDKFEGVILYEIADECSFEHPKTKKKYKHIWVKFPSDEIPKNYTDEIFLKDKKEFDVLNVFITNNKGIVYAKTSFGE